MRTLEPTEFDIRSAPHLQENIRSVGSIITIADVLSNSYADEHGVEYSEFSLITSIDNRWIRISMEEYLKFNITNGEHHADVDDNMVFPGQLQIISSVNRKDMSGDEYYYYKAYKGQFDYSKLGGISHHKLITTEQYPEHRYGKVQDYTVKIVG